MTSLISDKMFVIDQSRCIGCESCVQACEECGTHRGQSLIHLEYLDRGANTQTAPMVCMHCEDPTCAEVCPADAIKQNEDGVVQSALKPHYLGVEHRRVAYGPDGRADLNAVTDSMDANTVLIVGSAPCYPFGVIDPIEDLGRIADEAGTLCHVDACLGGWLLPFWQRIGRDVPPWDLRVDGVTSISADIHKYGYCFKGVSTVMYRDPALAKKQVFWFDDWPGGLYASGTTAGTRPGSPIAGAWAVINHLGIEGYERLARRVAAATDGFFDAIARQDGLQITSNPDMSVCEFGAADGSGVDINAVGDQMDDRGWALDRQHGGLHLMLSPGHDRVIDHFTSDLADAVAAGGTDRGEHLPYGGVVGLNG